MAIVSLPSDEALKSLGRLTIYFAELEFFLNWCLRLLHNAKTEAEERKINNREFTRRAEDLNKMLAAASAPGGKLEGPEFAEIIRFTPSLSDLGNRRNLLTHGAAYNMIIRQPNGGQIKTIYKHSSRSGKSEVLHPADIAAFTKEVETAVNKLTALSLALVPM
jgi:hypothetical protein